MFDKVTQLSLLFLHFALKPSFINDIFFIINAFFYNSDNIIKTSTNSFWISSPTVCVRWLRSKTSFRKSKVSFHFQRSIFSDEEMWIYHVTSPYFDVTKVDFFLPSFVLFTITTIFLIIFHPQTFKKMRK